jgi:hypothetical protein
MQKIKMLLAAIIAAGVQYAERTSSLDGGSQSCSEGS